MKTDQIKYDVFISCKSEDYPEAIAIHEYLEEQGLRVFMADVELRKKGRDVYGEIIDSALESVDHMIVFTSNAAYVNSTYVKSEWRTFVEEKRSGRKTGNIVTILKGVQIDDLPIALRSVQFFPYGDYASVIDYLPIQNPQISAPDQPPVASPSGTGALIHVESDLDCRIFRFGKEIGLALKGEDTLIRLTHGKHKLEFVSLDNDADRLSILFPVPENDYEDILTVELLAVKQQREAEATKAETESLVQEETEQENIEHKNVNDNSSKNVSKDNLTRCKTTYNIGDYYCDGIKQGVVFEVSSDGKHGKILSLEQSLIRVRWCSVEEFVAGQSKTEAFDEEEGMNNQRKIQQINGWSDKYPAFKWCADQGEGWYLPAIEELKLFTLNDTIRNAVNRTLQAKEGIKLFDRGDEFCDYWSSTESKRNIGFNVRLKEWKDSACGVYMYNGDTHSSYKNSNYYVRAVSAF
ncbi:MAG: TIR domain-containing protein [Alistipes sp.]|nr:TIR domain-containing protein [Alistipes sp.]